MRVRSSGGRALESHSRGRGFDPPQLHHLKRGFPPLKTPLNLLINNLLYIADIGASGGLDSRWEKYAPYYRSVLFEPDQRAFCDLKSSAGVKSVIINKALSDKDAEITFNLCRKQQVSSAHLPNYEFINKFPDPSRFEVTKKLKLSADSLDGQLLRNKIEYIDFIKIDTQGHELAILKGAMKTIPQATGIEVEVGFAPIYDNQPQFGEIDGFLRSFGFEVIDISRAYWKRSIPSDYRGKGQIVCGDALYFKTPENLCSSPGIDEKKLIRSFFVYLAYNYADIADVLANLSLEKCLISREKYDLLILYLNEYRRRFSCPVFPKKERIYSIFIKIANLFSEKNWCFGSDRFIGNP